MILNPAFVLAMIVNTPKYAFFKVYAEMMRTSSQRALSD